MHRFKHLPLPGARPRQRPPEPIGAEIDVSKVAGPVFPSVEGAKLARLPRLSTALADMVAHSIEVTPLVERIGMPAPSDALAPAPATTPPIVATNPASQTPALAYGGPGDVYGQGFMPDAGPVTDEEMLANAQTVVGAVRTLFGGAGPAPSWLPQGRDVPPPRLILPADLGRWPPARNAFPVFVTYPGFGPGLAVRYLNIETSAGVPAGLYLAVKKMTPLGPVPSEPFSLGYYGVPVWMVQRVPVAVAQLFPAENVVVIDDYRGNQYSIDYVTFRSTADPRYELARRMLLLQYPYLMTDMFATRLLLEPPPDMKPGGALPPRLTQMPPALIPTTP